MTKKSKSIQEGISLLKKLDAQKSLKGRWLLLRWSMSGKAARVGLIASTIKWACKQKHCQIVLDAILALGVDLAVLMGYWDREYYEEHVFERLYQLYEESELDFNFNMTCIASILGDEADDDNSWDSAELWHSRVLDITNTYTLDHPKYSNVINMISRALQALSGYASRRDDYDKSLEYTKRNLKIYEDEKGEMYLFYLKDLLFIAKSANYLEETETIHQQILTLEAELKSNDPNLK